MKNDNILRYALIVFRSYVSYNKIKHSEAADLLVRIHACLSTLSESQALPSEAQITSSVQRNRLISFIDGKAYKALTWHLALHGLTPDMYRRRFGLPETYPMVAPSYDRREL